VDEGCSRVMEDRAKWMEGKMGSTEPDFIITRETPNHQLKSQVTYDYRTPTKKEEYSSNSDDLEDDEEVSNFVKRLNKGTDGRYRGKLPLIFFNCDGIGHFDNKCPHKKKRNDEGYSKGKHTYKGKRTTKKVFKKILCTKEDISSSNEDEVSDSETRRFLFMAVKDSDKEDSKEEYEEAKEECEEVEEEIEEAEVDFREELMCAIEVIRREKKKNKKLQA
jgi:hypothetical protein